MLSNPLIYNAIRTPDGTLLESLHRHDYKTHTDKNGETYMVDGGLDYARRYINKHPYEELSVYALDSHEKVREACRWGTRGKDGNEELRYIALKDMETDHILAVLDKQNNMNKAFVQAFKNELLYRDCGLV